jgi:HD-GYP domain-containing protein (c-di-GMP phosphodiesterase class II)
VSAFSLPDPGRELADRLRLACEAHDPAIGPHLDRVTRYACGIGDRLGLSAGKRSDLTYAIPLHDIGKIGLPLSLLHKPGKLTPEEAEIAKTHTLIGHRILAGSPWPAIQCAARIALGHHENWAGGGYPHGCAGETIPLEARIAAVADVFDALSSPRAYKQAWELDRVVAEMRRLRAVKFDPEILDVFLAHLPVPAEIA